MLLRPRKLTARLEFPDPRQAMGHPDNGLVAMGGDLSIPRLLLAYRSGIFPWTDDPITWWSPDPRGIFEWDRLHLSKSLIKILRQDVFTVTVNRAFRAVMEGCSRPEQPLRQWITPAFLAAYTSLHQAGHAHSVECWQNGQLAGGIYGVAVGGLFAGESMFYRVPNASKVALVHLTRRLQERGFSLFDIQMITPATAQLGAVSISREEYLQRLAAAVNQPCTFL